MKAPVTLTLSAPFFRQLMSHLFPGDGDEHGAVIAVGICETKNGTRLLARELFLALDGRDYVPGTYGYRALTAEFVARVSGYCGDHGLGYLAVHCHAASHTLAFSGTDLASHARGYPALLDIVGGRPVGGLVFGTNSVAGDIWTPQGRFELAKATVIGSNVKSLYAKPTNIHLADPVYDRHVRLFGDIGQQVLGGLCIGIVGLGGGGSLVNEWLSRLGVGHIVAIDFDHVENSNRPRIVGATVADARRKTLKVMVARRVARAAKPDIRFEAIIGDIRDESTARRLVGVDVVVLASDSIQTRLIFNALVHQYLIPGFQVGAKVTPDQNGRIADIFTATRPVLPFAGGGCLKCQLAITPGKLREEALSPEERRKQRYVDSPDVIEPSVITLNVLSAGQVVNDLMMMFTGLYSEDVLLEHHLNFPLERILQTVEFRTDELCTDCVVRERSRYAMGDSRRLPCRMPTQPNQSPGDRDSVLSARR